MSDEKRLSEEFEFIRDRLEKMAKILVRGEKADLIEVGFLIGCLHSICHEHAQKLKAEGK